MAREIPGGIEGVAVNATYFTGLYLEVIGIFEDDTGLITRQGVFRITFDFDVKRKHCEGWHGEEHARVEIPEVLLDLSRDDPRRGWGARVPASQEGQGPTIRWKTTS